MNPNITHTTLKARMARGATFGMNIYSTACMPIEVAGNWGLDFVFIDAEHTALGVDSHMEKLLLAANSTAIRVDLAAWTLSGGGDAAGDSLVGIDGIIGSAFMPISDNFPQAGITFWDCAHEGSGGMMADGFTRASGRMCMMIAQNGPGITNFVTPVKTAYWNHTPLLLVTPQAANKTIGMGGFQEVEQMALFKDMVAYQEEVRDPSRVAEVLNRVIINARRASAPAQINMPRDYWTQVIDIDLPEVVQFERPAGGGLGVAAGLGDAEPVRLPDDGRPCPVPG